MLWRFSAESWVNLLPEGGWLGGFVTGAHGNAQVGYVTIPGFSHAAYWQGSASSFVDLHPQPGYYGSRALAITDRQAVGFASSASTASNHAIVWLVEDGTWNDLHVPGASWTQAFATDGVRQGGWGQFPSYGYQQRALMWSGSAASVIDMHPTGAGESRICGMAGTAQVGWGIFDGEDRGLVWRGGPASAINVHPPAARGSQLYATTGTTHAGYVDRTGWAEAAVWTSDQADSCVDLHALLGPGWFTSVASCVTVSNDLIIVGGKAARSSQSEAVIWTRRLPQSESPARRPKPQTPLPPGLAPDDVRAP